MSQQMTVGLALQGRYPPDEFESFVRMAEEIGINHLWLTDSSLHTRNPYVYLAAAARITSAMTLGTAVTNPQTRHPGIVAVNAATLEELAPGRTILGIGAGDRPLHALGMRPAGLAELRSAIEVIRELMDGEHVDSDGPGFNLVDAHLRFATRQVPVYVSASGPKTLNLAGEIADGVILLSGLFEEGVAYGIEQIEIGAARAGRARPHIAVFGYGAIDDDRPERALAASRSIAGWFPQTAPFYCELAGLDPDIAARVRSHYAGGEFQEAAKAAAILPDEFVRKMAFAGDSSQAKAHLETLSSLGVDSVHLFPLGDQRRQTLEKFASLARPS